ncbi:MAG: crossover junction endodeoxyribonuclease RuvC [Chloroflexi bacterium]|nr:crossover junction endodeoxyribonuclease RuvC [Chloroflexota bacterium]
MGDRLVLGVDPGTAATGYGLVRKNGDSLALVDHGVISTASHTPLPERLHSIYKEITGIIARHHPQEVVVERLYFSSNVQSAMAVGQARGVVLLAAAQAGLPVYEYRPQEVKQSVAGYGRATKEQVQELVRMILGLDFTPKPDDAADAIALAICHLNGKDWNRE